jgi:predicted enzyme related to lactoylglutathione lyase
VVSRIIPEIRSDDLGATRAFYCDLIGLKVDMAELPAFLLLSSPTTPAAQLIVNDNGHTGLPPGFAIDVEIPERVDAIHAEVTRRGMPIVEPITTKPWGIRRFSVIDPNGVRVTIVSHIETRG